MASAAQPARVPLDLRRILSSGLVTVADLKPLIWNRLQGDRVGPAEDPTTLLTDFVRQNHRPAAAVQVRLATAQLLHDHTNSSHAPALGELCALAAAVCDAEVLDPLQFVITRPDASALMASPAETLRHRAFRSLLAFLIIHPFLAHGPGESSLQNLLYLQAQYPDSRILALTSLIGLWPDAASRVRQGNVLPHEHAAVNQLLFQSGFTSSPSPE